jgi:hypothetical protein
MLRTPFLGTQLNYILPGLMLTLSLVFLVLRYLKYEKKAVTLIKRLNDKLEKIYGQSVENIDQTSEMQKQQDKIAGKIERLYKGEIAYLKEVKQLRDSSERKQKLLQGKQHLQKRQIIPQAFTTDAAASFAQFDENMR